MLDDFREYECVGDGAFIHFREPSRTREPRYTFPRKAGPPPKLPRPGSLHVLGHDPISDHVESVPRNLHFPAYPQKCHAPAAWPAARTMIAAKCDKMQLACLLVPRTPEVLLVTIMTSGLPCQGCRNGDLSSYALGGSNSSTLRTLNAMIASSFDLSEEGKSRVTSA